MKYLIKNINVFDSNSEIQTNQNIYISKGKIENFSYNKNNNDKKCQIIDGANKLLVPVITDLYSNLKTPGEEHRSILDQEISAAIAGGITNVCCQPATDPVLDEPSLIKDLISKANKIFPINIKPFAAITKNLAGEQLSEMKELFDAGAIGFSQAEKPIIDTKVLLRAFEYAKTFGFTLFLRPTENYLSKNTYANESSIATRLGLKGSNRNSEIIEILKYIALSKDIGTKIHLSKISCKESLEIIEKAKNENINVTCDVSINQLLFSEQDIDGYNTDFHLVPPLRSKIDQKEIFNNIENDVIDAISSDHCPVDLDKKMLPFEESEPGASSFETFLPLIFKIAQDQQINITKLLSKISLEPYKILNNKKYDLNKCANIDFCLYDESQSWIPSQSSIKTSGKNIPFEYELQGRVSHTFVDGEKIYEL